MLALRDFLGLWNFTLPPVVQQVQILEHVIWLPYLHGAPGLSEYPVAGEHFIGDAEWKDDRADL